MTPETDSAAQGDRENVLATVRFAFALAGLPVPEADAARTARTLARLGAQARLMAVQEPAQVLRGVGHAG